jgi:hypothetical protein
VASEEALALGNEFVWRPADHAARPSSERFNADPDIPVFKTRRAAGNAVS